MSQTKKPLIIYSKALYDKLNERLKVTNMELLNLQFAHNNLVDAHNELADANNKLAMIHDTEIDELKREISNLKSTLDVVLNALAISADPIPPSKLKQPTKILWS